MKKKKGILNDFRSRKDDYNTIRRILEQAHIDVDDLSNKEIDLQLKLDTDESKDSNKDKEDSVSKVSRFSHVSSRHSMHTIQSTNQQQNNNKKISSDNIIPLANKLKYGESEIHIGRISYRANMTMRPTTSSLRRDSLSRVGSSKSINSQYSTTNIDHDKPKFYLDHSDYEDWNQDSDDLDIPDAIQEEDERNLTIQKSVHNQKMHVNQIFSSEPNENTSSKQD